jgi:hypothetical protein
MAEYYCYGEELFIKCILDKLEANGLLEYCSNGIGIGKNTKSKEKPIKPTKLSKAEVIKQEN